MLLPAMINNVDGAIGSTYNVNGLRSRKIMELAQEGKIQEALAVQNDTNDLIEAILDNGLYPTIKQLLKLQGCDSGAFLSRKPMAYATQAQIDRSKEIYEAYLKDIK